MRGFEQFVERVLYMKDPEWKILLIDDDPGIRKVLAIALEDAGYSVITAADGESGIQAVQEHSPQIVLTDIRMPGMNGLEVLRKIKKMDPEREVIVITGFNEIQFAIEALHLDASDFITKPVSDGALSVALMRAKERYRTRKELRDYAALLEERWITTAEELAKTFHFQQMLIENSIDGIVACDTEGKTVIFNQSMEGMLGWDKNEVIGRKALDDFFAENEAERFHSMLASDEYGGPNRLFLYETFLLSRSNVRIPCQASAVVLSREGREVGVVCFFRDLRELRKLAQQVEDQARLLHQDKMIAMGKLAASVVHEINNPVAGMLNFARLMQRILNREALTPENTEKFKGYLSLMESELSRCSKIISNLLAFSRKSALEFGDVNLNEMLNRCILLSEHRLAIQNISLDVRLDPRLPVVAGDFNQLQQCVINLIFNAIDAMPQGGEITLESIFDPNQRLAQIRVSDSGIGIREGDLPYVFDPFFTTKTEGKGIGLGLSTVYGIIDRHHGRIEVKSRTGEGAVFTISLPVSA